MAYATLASPADGDAKAAEAELRATLQKILNQGVPADLVEAAKIQEERQAEFQKNSIAGLASILSEAVAGYNLRSPDEDLEPVKKGTAADANPASEHYLRLDPPV